MGVGKKIKDKKVIQLGRVVTPKKRLVTEDSPLIGLSIDHPDYDSIEIIESSFSVDDDAGFDIENSDLLISDSDSVDYFSGVENIPTVQLSLDVPSNIVADIVNINKYASPDGTQRISLKVNFDEVLRAKDYEVRIASV